MSSTVLAHTIATNMAFVVNVSTIIGNVVRFQPVSLLLKKKKPIIVPLSFLFSDVHSVLN